MRKQPRKVFTMFEQCFVILQLFQPVIMFSRQQELCTLLAQPNDFLFFFILKQFCLVGIV